MRTGRNFNRPAKVHPRTGSSRHRHRDRRVSIHAPPSGATANRPEDYSRELLSIPTAPTIRLPDGWTLSKFTRGQKGADKANDPVLCVSFSVARVTTGFVSLSSLARKHHCALPQKRLCKSAMHASKEFAPMMTPVHMSMAEKSRREKLGWAGKFLFLRLASILSKS